MVKRIKPSPKDLFHLEKLRKFKDISNSTQPANYKNRVVIKPWGYEYLIFENESVAVWILYLKPGALTSMHCHPGKKTSLVVLQGKVVCSSLTNQFERFVGDGLLIDKGAFHQTRQYEV